MDDKWMYIMFIVIAIVGFSFMGFMGYCDYQYKTQLINKYPEVYGHTKQEAGKIIARIEKEKREALRSTTQKATD